MMKTLENLNINDTVYVIDVTTLSFATFSVSKLVKKDSESDTKIEICVIERDKYGDSFLGSMNTAHADENSRQSLSILFSDYNEAVKEMKRVTMKKYQIHNQEAVEKIKEITTFIKNYSEYIPKDVGEILQDLKQFRTKFLEEEENSRPSGLNID